MNIHKPVLLGEAIEGLGLEKGSIVVDATLGSGGHSKDILSIIGDEGILIAIDVDEEAIKRFAEFPNKSQIPISKLENTILVNRNFSELDKILEILKIEKVDAILADLGYSSDQLENTEYGLSFQKDAPLDMRLDRKRKITAKDIINKYSQEDLAEIIKEFGEDRWARKIAQAIVDERKKKSIETTKELAEIIKKTVPVNWKQKIHPATRTFQALRIAVNQELTNLNLFLEKAIEALKSRGRLAVISFHSIEDRIVKNKFRENARGCICPPRVDEWSPRVEAGPSDFPKCLCGREVKIKIINKKPIIARDEEREGNPRSRSAKLRIIEKI